MYGAILGDLIGSPWEFNRIKHRNFPLLSKQCVYTDDTIMTVAIADALLHDVDPAGSMRAWAKRFKPQRGGYGAIFYVWLNNPDDEPYGSFGNGGAMRVSPAAMLGKTLDEVLAFAKRATICTHDHPEGVRAALATAHGIWLARQGAGPDDIRTALENEYRYNLSRPYEEVQASCVHTEHADPSVPEAITCALQSSSFEDCMYKVVALGGDSDTQAAVAGPISEMLWGIPNPLQEGMRTRVPEEMMNVIDRTYGLAKSG
jgi:ADP-ribosyl-[dinitrogen reductase] hydrolase